MRWLDSEEAKSVWRSRRCVEFNRKKMELGLSRWSLMSYLKETERQLLKPDDTPKGYDVLDWLRENKISHYMPPQSPWAGWWPEGTFSDATSDSKRDTSPKGDTMSEESGEAATLLNNAKRRVKLYQSDPDLVEFLDREERKDHVAVSTAAQVIQEWIEFKKSKKPKKPKPAKKSTPKNVKKKAR